MNIRIPDTFMGKPIEGAIERLLKGTPSEPQENPQPPVNSPSDLSNPEEYIVLPRKSHGSQSYSDLWVAMHRLSYDDPQVKDAAQRLSLKLLNTAQEQNGRPYIGRIDWKEALRINLTMGNSTLRPREGIDFLLLLKDGIEERITVYNGARQPVPKEKLNEIYDEIVGVRNPYRAEWLDADYKTISGELWIYSSHVLQGTTLEPRIKEKLLPHLTGKAVKVNLLKFNEQGMPTESGSDIHYWMPDKDNNSVAWFRADSGRADLSCGRVPSGSHESLGVRAARANLFKEI